jgi:hypothetical protein
MWKSYQITWVESTNLTPFYGHTDCNIFHHQQKGENNQDKFHKYQNYNNEQEFNNLIFECT